LRGEIRRKGGHKRMALIEKIRTYLAKHEEEMTQWQKEDPEAYYAYYRLNKGGMI